MFRRFKSFAVMTTVAAVSITTVLAGPQIASAADRAINMLPGDTLSVNCDTHLSGKMTSNAAHMACATVVPTATAIVRATATIAATATQVATATSTATAAATSTATSTATAIATATNTAVATATATVQATATLVGGATATPIVNTTPTAGPTQVPMAGQACPQWLHDSYVNAGPDGKMYPTWHPPVDPQYGCFFGHEHGDDPRTSTANSSLPAFGYAAAVMGMTEPHSGYKVFRLNVGEHDGVESDVHGDQAVSTVAFRSVFHTGTSGPGRASQQFHSMQADFVGPAGEFHVYGMADTGRTEDAFSTCTTPRGGAKDFSMTDCPDTYEIWTGTHFEISTAEARATCCTGPFQVPLHVSVSPAVFDPITSFDPTDLTRLIYTASIKPPNVGGVLQDPSINPTSAQSWAQGCNRENYVGPNYWNNVNGPLDYWTDAMGVIGPNGGDAQHPIHQFISQNYGTGDESFKKHASWCGNGIHAPN